MTYAIDFSSAAIDPHAPPPEVEAFCQYATHGSWCLTQAKAQSILTAGRAIVCNFEDSPTRPLDGFQAGVDDAHFANGVFDTCGAPPDVPIYYSCDFDANAAEVTAYYQGVASVPGRPVGMYGGSNALGGMLGNTVKFWWQSKSRSFSSVWPHPLADLCQLPPDVAMPFHIPGVPDSAYDVNLIQHPYGAWGGTAMPLTQQDLDAIQAQVANRIIGTLQTNLKDAVTQIVAAVNAHVVAAGGQPVDYAAIAKAVEDEAARRLAQ